MSDNIVEVDFEKARRKREEGVRKLEGLDDVLENSEYLFQEAIIPDDSVVLFKDKDVTIYYLIRTTEKALKRGGDIWIKATTNKPHPDKANYWMLVRPTNFSIRRSGKHYTAKEAKSFEENFPNQYRFISKKMKFLLTEVQNSKKVWGTYIPPSEGEVPSEKGDF